MKEKQPMLFDENQKAQLTKDLEMGLISIDRLKYHPKNEKILPKLTKSEKFRLKDRIKQYGFIEAIEITNDNVILDGNNRIRILTEYSDELNIDKVPYTIIDIPEDDEVRYIIEKNSNRRQLSPLVMSYLRGKEYNEMKQGKGGNIKGINQYNKKEVGGKNFLQPKTFDKLASKYGVTGRTIKNDGKFAEHLDLICHYKKISEPFSLIIKEDDEEDTVRSKKLVSEIYNAIIEFIELQPFYKYHIDKYLFDMDKKLIEIIDDFLTSQNPQIWKKLKPVIIKLNECLDKTPESYFIYEYDIDKDEITKGNYNLVTIFLGKIKSIYEENNKLSITDINESYNNIVHLKEKTKQSAESRAEYYRDAKNKEELEELQKQKKLEELRNRIQIRNGDFKELCKDIKDNSIDCIITDPPYPKEYLEYWKDLSEISSRILKPGSFLITYTGKYYLPEVITQLSSHLKYYWQFVLLHTGSLAAVHPVKINTGYKPILVYYKPYTEDDSIPVIEDYVKDIIEGSGREKEHHEWEQSVDEMQSLLDIFTKSDDLILDPFAGSGSIGVLCKQNNRRCILMEINKDHCDTMKDRLYNV